MKLLSRVWKDISSGQNLDVYITVLIAIAVAVLGALDIADVTIIFSAVLATLALVSTSLLVNRHESEEIRNVFSTMKDKHSVADEFFSLGYDLEEQLRDIRNSKTVYF
jgi:hypothetical protein